MDSAAMGRNESRQSGLNELHGPQHSLRGRGNALETCAELTEHPRTVHCTEPTSHTHARTCTNHWTIPEFFFFPTVLFVCFWSRNTTIQIWKKERMSDVLTFSVPLSHSCLLKNPTGAEREISLRIRIQFLKNKTRGTKVPIEAGELRNVYGREKGTQQS